jgi:GMP synthase (glutamine-hydrolysing)
MRLHFIQHVPFERPAAIAVWAETRGISYSVTKVYRPPLTARAVLPSVDDFDAVVVLGGPMGVDDTEEYPWLEEEIELIRESFTAGRKAVGICLGGQLIAKALGAGVRRARFTEIGWFDVRRVEPSVPTLEPIDKILPDHFPAFHWHSDAFEIPDTAISFLESDACGAQAFLVPGKALALQFHLEMGPANIEAMLENCASELGTGRYVQSPDAIRTGAQEHPSLARALLDKLLDWFLLGRIDEVDGRASRVGDDRETRNSDAG